ncbi:MAG: hypothetical protein ACI4D8_05995 [Wujia sp.]
MPSINRIRVNNVKYNFGTQFYDDFTMRLHGKNTLYDLANGGGKSVLMLLLLQNMLPNCTLDDKQPIEKLFRTGNANTTIHSLVEWKLDEGDDPEGYRYMTTGFCARKAKEEDGDSSKSEDVASIEYYNYCIFYREYNKNDIINLPLVKDGERISYSGLRSYLKELPHRDMSLRVVVYDRKGEYQRFISQYGIHESQWEIIRGINKTEGHVRTYFENNYKTTRKVVEDLLIEEIIEKAYDVKTSREEDGSQSMAKMLLDIKEQLTELAQKKKCIAGYGHQIELIEVLKDRVASFVELYLEQSKLTGAIADICVTGEEFAKNDEEKMNRLAKERDDKQAEKDYQRKHLECLKVARDKNTLKDLKQELEALIKRSSDCKERLKQLQEDKNLKVSVNDYLEYIQEREKYNLCDSLIKTMLTESDFDEEALYTYAYNIKMRTDVILTELDRQQTNLEAEIEQLNATYNYHEKMLQETRVALAVAENTAKASDEEIKDLSSRLSDVRMSMNDIKFADTGVQLQDKEVELSDIQTKMAESKRVIESTRNKLVEDRLELSLLGARKDENLTRINTLAAKEKEYRAAVDKLDNIMLIYNAKDISVLADTIRERITSAVLEHENIEREIKALDKKIERLAEGRIISVNSAAAKVIDYIETRHGIPAMYGMDYLSALTIEQQKEVLAKNPELPYGVIVREFEAIKDDPNILTVDTGDFYVHVYDMEAVEEKAIYYGDNAFTIHAGSEYLTDPDTVTRLIQAENDRRQEYKERLSMNEEIMSTYRQDQEFVLRIQDSEALTAAETLKKLNKLAEQLDENINECNSAITSGKILIDREEKALAEYDIIHGQCMEDINRLQTVRQLSELIEDKEKISKAAKDDVVRLRDKLQELLGEYDDRDRELAELKARRNSIKQKADELKFEWENNYKAYYNIDTEYKVLSIEDDELKARFTAMLSMGQDDAKAVEDKRALMETLKNSMERIIKNIEGRGVSIEKLRDYEYRHLLYQSDEEVLASCHKSIDDTRLQLEEIEKDIRSKESAINKLEGSIEYAISNIEAGYGEYEDLDASLSEIVAALENGEAMLARIAREAKECDEEYRRYMKQQGYMLELYKDVKRIVTTNDISLKDAKLLIEDKDKLREIFEDKLMRFDRNNKSLEKAKNELLKFKGNTAAALDSMEVFELAATIRDDVSIPENYDEACALVENLGTITEYIALERDRVEKSLADMETIKENFEEQCLQRCLDVKTELDKLPKLSKIIADGEAIQMVGLSIPYVKEEFRRQRMSEYIDRVVAQADDYTNDKDRMKFIRNSLTLKKLFGVIVIDMNAIKLNLYKRERIKEQSRYLRYEEAVGSTGQSQGIYIQFLISIINYISGMYRMGDEDTRTKTIFIDNPFGAAKDVYIWEPIFALLKANNVQLIVPARGATPAITGRFDVNYILGQQMQGGRQLTVVTDYTSRVDQEEVEYRDLEYEQVSFDFI